MVKINQLQFSNMQKYSPLGLLYPILGYFDRNALNSS